MPVTPLRDADPTRVGRHRLLGRLGQGGMGTVFLGVSPDDRAVAVKVLRDGLSDPDARRRFRHELEALRRVRGPHLVEVLDADVEADIPFLVTRFVPGTRLDDLVNRSGPLPLAALLPLARGIADALTVLHAEGVVHRDLTPGNVLVLDGEPHVIDLGLAMAADVTALTRSGLVIGTPGYLAPEQVTGSVFTEAVDVHAWGATLAFAATGRPPYGTGRPEAVLYRIVHGEPDLDGIPAELRELVSSAMDPDPRQRPAARDLLSRLGGASQAETVVVHLPHDVDATTALATDAMRTRELVTSRPQTSQPRLIPWDDEVTAVTELPPPETYLPPYDATAYDDGAYDETAYDDGAYADDGVLAPLPARTHPARALQVAVTALAGLAVVAAGTLTAPVVGALSA
ncbi:MAG: serine/threonine protein kinase, partial [Frankiales bacterium]|nr:serine/threonine protein kinase [Frankiales bacterium]